MYLYIYMYICIYTYIQGIVDRRILLASNKIPFTSPPPSCTLHGMTLASISDAKEKMCQSSKCPINIGGGEATGGLWKKSGKRMVHTHFFRK